MQPAEILESIYKEHRRSVPLMVGTLLDMEVPAEDARLLGVMPWKYPANRIAVERERLGLSPVHPLLHFKLPPPPPAWLTPALIVKIFQLALDGPGEPPPGAEDDDRQNAGEHEAHGHDHSTAGTLVLPA